MRALVAFDLDGTLWDSQGVDYEDAESIRRDTRFHMGAILRVRSLHTSGVAIAYVTGRADHVRHVTTQQLRDAGLPPARLFMQTTWQGYDAMAQFKAACLKQLGAHVYVGDHEADEQAARLAGIPFFHATAWRAGHPLPLTTLPTLPERRALPRDHPLHEDHRVQSRGASMGWPEAGLLNPEKGVLTQLDPLHPPQDDELTVTIRFASPEAREALLAVARHMVDVEIVRGPAQAPGGVLR